MNICASNHDEVCYEGRHCPVCVVADDLNADIGKYQDKVSELENQIGELEGTIEDLSTALKDVKETTP